MTKLLVRLFVKDSANTADPDVRQRYGIFVGITGIILNIFLFSGKFIAGIITTSISVTADAFNNLSDAGSSIITLVGFKMAGMPADKEHPFGHGRIEYISALIVSFVIIFMGIELGKSSFDKILTPESVEFSWISFSILFASICVKFWLCLFNKKIGGIINSTAMKAAAMDSLSDVLSTSAVIIGLVITTLTGVNIDGYMGCLVAVFIIYTGLKTAKESLEPLLGERPDKELVKEIEDTVMSYDNIIGVHDMIVHNYGVGISMITLHAEVPCKMDFTEAHELIDLIEDDLKIKYHTLATIHMDPVANDDEEVSELKRQAMEIIENIDPIITMHDFRMTKGKFHINLIFDIVVPFKYKLADSELVEKITEEIMALDDRYFAVISVDKSMS